MDPDAMVAREVPDRELASGPLATRIEEVYADAFGAPPYLERSEAASAFVERLRAQTDREGHRLLVVERDGEPIGFVWGYASRPGQWWHDRVTARLDAATLQRWFDDAYVVVELAVRRDAQGRGAGSLLVERLLEGVPQRTALAMTLRDDNPAVDFYRARGWRTCVDGFRFGDGDVPRLILGRDLAAEEERAARGQRCTRYRARLP